MSHLRFGPDPIRSTYLIEDADFVACHQFGLLERINVVATARPGATLLLNAPYPADEVWDHLPQEVQRQVIDKGLSVWTVDASRIAREVGLGGRINTVMQPCFFALSDVIDRETPSGSSRRASRRPTRDGDAPSSSATMPRSTGPCSRCTAWSRGPPRTPRRACCPPSRSAHPTSCAT